ncbi:MAG: GNAT family N-acetyltransferase [Methylobacteriaceae bacterium]|nr:GNAT family N-acetyltransferase [Methylobacteriaceae bacterium]
MAWQEIRRVAARDEARWRELWAGYIAFYRGSVTKEATAALWSSLLADEGEVRGYVADRGEGPVGLVHYVFHRSTWSTQPICYLQDLYVAKGTRGGGVARELMEACFADAKAAGAFRVYWQTQEYNGAARSLYDTIVPRSSFIVYRKPL